MKKSYQQNRDLLGRKKALKEMMGENKAKYRNKYTFASSTPEKLDQLRLQLQEEKRQNTIKLTFLLVGTFFIVGLLAYWLLFR